MKRTLMLILIVLLIVTGFYAVWCLYVSERRDRQRLEENQRTLMEDVTFYRTRDSLSAASVERLTLTNREFREYADELKQTVEELQLKVRRLQSASRTAVETHYPVTVRLRDTVVLCDTLTVTDTLRRLHYENPWLTLDGTVCGDDLFRGDILSRDTLVQAVHRVPHRFWFICWGTKAVRQEVTTRNPYSRITYTEYLELKRRKKR
ncbi:MAG: DUF6549 family protein [Odoribacter splanchnicus]